MRVRERVSFITNSCDMWPSFVERRSGKPSCWQTQGFECTHCCRFGEGTRILGCKECQAASCPKCKHGKSVRGFEHLLVFFAQSCTTTQQYTVTTSGEVGFSHRLVDSCGISSQVPLARNPTHRSQNKKLPIFDRPQPTPEQIVELFLPLQAARQNLTLKNRQQRSCLKRVRMSLYKNIPRIS